MSIIISHRSALEFWRSSQGARVLRAHRSRATDRSEAPPDARCSLDEIEALKTRMRWLSEGPVHVLVQSGNARTKNRRTVCHTCARPLPPGSLIKVDEGLFACSPEFVVLQMAAEVSLAKCIELGFEFCGSYRLRSGAAGFVESAPLTTVEEIERFIAQAHGMKGGPSAAKALRFVVDRSVSPMETVVVVLLCHPIGRGGMACRLLG